MARLRSKLTGMSLACLALLAIIYLAFGTPADLAWHRPDPVPNSSELAAVVGRYVREVLPLDHKIDPFDTPSVRMNDVLSNFQDGTLVPSTDLLRYLTKIPAQTVQKLKKVHTKALDALPDSISARYFRGSGVVTLAGGIYFPAFLVALRQLRQVNAEIPVELFFIRWSEYEAHYCEQVLPTMGVTCRVLEQLYGSDLTMSLGPGYPPKILAILSSSFENAFYMDSDVFMLSNPEVVFSKPPFIHSGLVTFPDFWVRTEAPAFYEIANVQLRGQSQGIAQSQRPGAMPGRTTDSGALFVSKSKHARSLLLAMYYAIHGDTAYNMLMTQGAPGHGGR